MTQQPQTKSDPSKESDVSSRVEAPQLTLPKGGGALRSIAEKLNLNPVTGTGSFTVSVYASPGRSAFGPQLSLTYDSGSGNGPFGFGWSLATSAITTCSAADRLDSKYPDFGSACATLMTTNEFQGRSAPAPGNAKIRRLFASTFVVLGLAIIASAVAQGADGPGLNPEYQVRVVVNTKAKWVPTSQSNARAYYKADLESVNISVETSNPKLADDVEHELTERLRSMQKTLDSHSQGDWIIVPQRQPNEPKFPPDANLLQHLFTYQGQDLVIQTLPPPGKDDEFVPLRLTTFPISVYEEKTIAIKVNEPHLNSEMPVTFRMEEVWNAIPKGAIDERRIPVEVYQSEFGCNHPDKKEIAKRTASMAARLYEQLYPMGLKISSFSVSPQTQYGNPIRDWARSVSITPVTVRWIPETGELRITGLPVVYGVALAGLKGSVADFGSLGERLTTRACNQLAGFALTNEGKATFEYIAEQDPAVKVAVATYDCGVLKLTISPQPTFAHLNGSAGTSYSNKTGWTGKANVTGQDLIRSQKHYDYSNSMQFSYQGGGSFQDAAATVSVTKPSRDPLPRLEFYSLALGGSFTQNQNDRFGGALPGQVLTVSETQATSGLKLAYDSYSIFDISEDANLTPPTRKLNRHQILFPLHFVFDRFLATSNHGSHRSSGDIFQFSVSPDYTYTHNFDSLGKKNGWSSLTVETTAEYIKGKNESTSMAFDRYLGSVTITACAGLLSTHQFLFRGMYGVGSLSAGGPIVRTFQLGGTQWVPGMQFGEDSGQTLGFAQGEGGIDIPTVMKLFGRSVPPDTKIFDIKSSYLKMVYSRASVSQKESVSAVAGLGPSVESFGPAVELARLNHVFDLTAGYMYSPQSALHLHGTFYLTVRLTDYRMR